MLFTHFHTHTRARALWGRLCRCSFSILLIGYFLVSMQPETVCIEYLHSWLLLCPQFDNFLESHAERNLTCRNKKKPYVLYFKRFIMSCLPCNLCTKGLGSLWRSDIKGEGKNWKMKQVKNLQNGLIAF